MKPFTGNIGAGWNSNCILSVPAFVPQWFYFETYRNAWITKSFLTLFTHKENWKYLSFVSLSYWFRHIPWLDSEVQFSTQLSLKWSIHCQWSWEGWRFLMDAWLHWKHTVLNQTDKSICVRVCARCMVVDKGSCRDAEQWKNRDRH